ncbi:DUF998 domain-containing protein [Actinomadura craniellae]|uniref:DUF998 domain-containing protein n=1 Tax=Actinomadura craniellae TaxID=2231787 RepID=A0A365H7H2_9ACTN|nr:DUF998 domain-containing protein [Actinomadura craniellae]RAY14968.1 DUF998 domain-containing protein [Actinomadura craniellae]
MSIAQLTTTAPGTAAGRTAPRNRALLACGVAAGPVFAAVAAAQVLTRDGFDLGRHALSLLSLGDLGWIQIANFVVAGALSIAAATGLRRLPHGGGGGTWGPRLVAGYGAGLIAAGLFVADPSTGFPAGAPEGMPESLSWHGILHGVAAPVAFLSLLAGCAVFARRNAARGRRGRAAADVATIVTVLALLAWPDHGTFSVRLAAASAVVFAWLAVTSADALTDPE